MDNQILYSIGTALIIVGIILLIITVVYMSVRKTKNGQCKTKAAGIIMIGPIPIIFGTDKKSVKTVIMLALALIILLIIAMIVYYFLWR